MSTGIERIAAERKRQVEDEGWDEEHDDEHNQGELAIVAACYAAAGDDSVKVLRFGVDVGDSHLPAILDAWPDSWDPEWDKREQHSRLRQLTIAGALIAAEIDRLLRVER